MLLFSDSNAVTSPKIKSLGLAGSSQIPIIPGRPLMREAGTKHAALMPGRSNLPLERSSPDCPDSMQRGHTHDGPGMTGDKCMTSPEGCKMIPSVSDARGRTRK